MVEIGVVAEAYSRSDSIGLTGEPVLADRARAGLVRLQARGDDEVKIYRPVTVLVGVLLVIAAGLIRLALPEQMLETRPATAVCGTSASRWTARTSPSP